MRYRRRRGEVAERCGSNGELRQHGELREPVLAELTSFLLQRRRARWPAIGAADLLSSSIELAWYHMYAYTATTGLAAEMFWKLTPRGRFWRPTRDAASVVWWLSLVCNRLAAEQRPSLPVELILYTARIAYGHGWT